MPKTLSGKNNKKTSNLDLQKSQKHNNKQMKSAPMLVPLFFELESFYSKVSFLDRSGTCFGTVSDEIGIDKLTIWSKSVRYFPHNYKVFKHFQRLGLNSQGF